MDKRQTLAVRMTDVLKKKKKKKGRTWRKKEDIGLIQQFPDQDTRKGLTRGPALYLHMPYDWPPAADPTP